MIRSIVKHNMAWVFLVVSMSVSFVALAITPVAHAQSAAPCQAAMILDRSGSVGATNLQTMREQIRRLFEPTGIYNDNIDLAFWSFSAATVLNPTSNYDAPYHDFISSIGVDPGFTSFMTQLNSMSSAGFTNYEQGLAYHYGQPNTFNNMEDIVANADILVFMTDGLPNTPAGANNPGSGADNNTYARNLARQAVLRHKANGKIVIGGMIGNANPRSLNYIINGSDTNTTDTFRISTTYNDLAQVLKQEIGDACDPKIPQSDYELVPRTSTDDRVITGTGNATIHYTVDNLSQNDTSEPSSWTIRRLVIARGQPVGPLENLSNSQGDPFVDEYSCAALLNLVNNQGNCTQVSSGTGTFPPGDTPLNSGTVSLDDQWPIGTRICFVLTIDQPTIQASPTNRFSSAACIIVGKRPYVQVWGGDLVAGRYFANDPIGSLNAADIRANIVTKSGSGGSTTYGSWSEYGAFATGNIIGFGTMRGLDGGSRNSDQSAWSSLTFANTQNEFGRFTSSGGSLGTVPNLSDTLLKGQNVDRNLTGVANITLGDSEPAGNVYMYEKSSGNLQIDASTIPKNRTIFVYVPEGNVTIAGNIEYFAGPYSSSSELPQVIIIAQNILIDESVTNVDAWLIANGGINSGIINTCNRSGTLTINICDSQLRINGPVLARELLLRRTAGAGSGGASGDPAEIINLRADTYLWAFSESRSEQRVQTTFATELPPYF